MFLNFLGDPRRHREQDKKSQRRSSFHRGQYRMAFAESYTKVVRK
jgi:hypothetical protein